VSRHLILESKSLNHNSILMAKSVHSPFELLSLDDEADVLEEVDRFHVL